MSLKGTRPYLVRAINEWILDSGWTPYLLVDVTWPNAELPPVPSDGGKLVLNLSPTAVRDLHLGQDEVAFSARFSGAAHYVRIPVGAILGIYARENGEGLFFSAEEYDRPPALTDVSQAKAEAPVKRPGLHIVK
jgi:stringent starvation protein B